jgi:23S rRNA pseudouridine2605 synthase
MISAGRVSVNGKVVRELGTKVDPSIDDIRVDGEPVLTAIKPKPLYIMLNKPVGYVSTVSDPHAERTVLDLLTQIEDRVYPVGRLDADSAGLLLLTNDGDFANRLTHPRYHIPKVYRIRARGFVGRDVAIRLSEGIDLPDGKTAPADLRFVEYDAATQCTILDMTLYEGRNRQVRRMMDEVEHPVRELTRIAFGNLRLKGLAPGTWRKLFPEEVAGLMAMAQATPTPKKEERRPKSRSYRPPNPAPHSAEEKAR